MNLSTSEFMALQARIDSKRKVPAKEASNGCDKESKLHSEIIQHCKSLGWIYFHGSMAHKTYRTVGEVDFCCLLPKGVTLFVECKRAGGKLSTEQLAIKCWMESLGHVYHVVHSLKEFIEICKESTTKETNIKASQ